jgi:hypothetical protein
MVLNWGIAFIVSDLLVATSLVVLLCSRRRPLPEALARRLPGGGRWLWGFLTAVVVLCYATLAPTFLYLLIHLKGR